MASEVDIVNMALTLLGDSRILSLDDDVKPARESKAIYAMTRDSLLAGYDWSFAIKRASIPALAVPPDFGFGYAYQMPTDCLRIIMIGDVYAGLDLTDYRGSPVEQYAIEGRQILTDLGAPLKLRYISRVEDTAQFHACFVTAFAMDLAAKLCEPLTQSDSKRVRAETERNHQISMAVRSNAIELPPQKLPDDEWLISRL